MMKYTIKKSFRFEAAHSLPHLREDHPCARPHGHSYVLDLELEGPIDANGFVCDFKALAPVKCYLEDKIDHRDLNEVFKCPTTSENLAREFFTIFVSLLLGHIGGANLISITVHETEKTWARYAPYDHATSLQHLIYASA